MDDAELLRHFVESRSQSAFGELVGRHIDWVYSAALRQVDGDRYRAEEVTQMVFMALARKAALLRRHPALLAWIHRSTRFAAANLRRAEMRRRTRETEAVEQVPAESDSVDWERLRPVLDDAVNELNQRDREAVFLRFFANEPFARVGERLGVTENAARMRVDRALDKLRAALERRGIASTAAAMGLALAGNAVSAAPAGTAASVASTALVGAAGGGGALAWLSLMSASKLQLAVAIALITAGTAGIVFQQGQNDRLESEIAAFRTQTGIRSEAAGDGQIAQLRLEHQRLARTAAEADSQRAAEEDLVRLRAEAAALESRAAAPATIGTATKAIAKAPTNSLFLPPQPVNRPAPIYPEGQRDAGNDGSVTIAMTVAKDGSARNVRALESSDPAFEDAAVKAVQNWKFQPGTHAGVPVNVRIAVPILFQLDPGDGSWF